MSSSDAPARETLEETEDRPWIAKGIAAGVVGALVIAVFFLVVDVIEGQAFWTPSALGSALFLGELAARDASPRPVLVVGYTAVHGTFFVAAGLIAAYASAALGRRRGWGRGLGLAALILLGLEVVFLVFAAVFAPGLLGLFGAGSVTVANALAAGAMAGFLMRGAAAD